MASLIPSSSHIIAPPPSSWVPRENYNIPEGPPEPSAEEQEREKRAAAAQAHDPNAGPQRRTRPRRTVDYFAGLDRWRTYRGMRRCANELHLMRPNPNALVELLPSAAYPENESVSLCTKYVHTSMNKIRCPVNLVRFTPDGRRLLTGSTSGEFTLWNGLTFNFESILQAHDEAVRCAEWSHSGIWLVSADASGTIKYFQNNMNNLQAFQGHGEAIRDVSFAPNDARFVTGADDSSIKIWNFEEMKEERTLTGHGWDVKAVKWHPTMGLIASGSKDNLVKFWDPRSGKALSTLHNHKNTVQAVQWNPDGNTLATACRDSFARVFDIRAMKELVTFKGHKKEACSLAWHPIHNSILSTGGSDGSVLHWSTLSPTPTPLEAMEHAHDATVWSLTYHPLGHLLVSGSNDFTTRFWTRARPGMPKNTSDRFHVGREAARELGAKEDEDDDDAPAPLPGIGGGGGGGASYNRSHHSGFDSAIPGFGGGGGGQGSYSGPGRYDGPSGGGNRAVYSGRPSYEGRQGGGGGGPGGGGGATYAGRSNYTGRPNRAEYTGRGHAAEYQRRNKY